MKFLLSLLVLGLSYLVGSIPFGAIIVRLKTGSDIRFIESGRTGGTNVMRAAGFWAGLFTAFLDILKGVFAVWLGRNITPGNIWVEVLSPIFAIIGHNYSIFLLERKGYGRLRLRGGAGGAPSAGGAIGLWPSTLLAIIPIGLLLLFGIGYASVTTMSIPIIASLVFAYRAWRGWGPWEYVLYGVLSELLLIWALRPNIKRLIEGNERVVGLRVWLKNKRGQPKNKSAHHQSIR